MDERTPKRERRFFVRVSFSYKFKKVLVSFSYQFKNKTSIHQKYSNIRSRKNKSFCIKSFTCFLFR